MTRTLSWSAPFAFAIALTTMMARATKKLRGCVTATVATASAVPGVLFFFFETFGTFRSLYLGFVPKVLSWKLLFCILNSIPHSFSLCRPDPSSLSPSGCSHLEPPLSPADLLGLCRLLPLLSLESFREVASPDCAIRPAMPLIFYHLLGLAPLGTSACRWAQELEGWRPWVSPMARNP